MQSLNLPYSPRIDQLRWLAAAIVFLFHFQLEYRGAGGVLPASPWWGLVTEGHTGVALFFTLSGFLFMQIALHQRRIVYRDFVINRVLRIFPLYLTVFMIALSIGRDKFQPQDILYLLSTNLGNSPTSISVVTGAAWCISLELAFYLVFPFLSRFAMERGASYLLGALGLMLFFKLMVYSENPHSTTMYFSTFVGRFDQFLIGMLGAMLYHDRKPAWARHSRWLLPLALLLVVGNSALQARVAPLNVLPRSAFWIGWSMLESAGWALFILSWVSWPGRVRPALQRLLNHGGKISFSFYLLHMGMIHMLVHKFGLLAVTGVAWLDGVLMLALVYAATWLLATLSYEIIEAPFLSLRRRYGAPLAEAPLKERA
jgi:peptidoglycan/LPS O-acetylase OafA/YrhL